MKKKTVIVTGGCGFVGSHLVDRLIQMNCWVRVIDNLNGGRLENLQLQTNEPKLDFLNEDIVTIDSNHSIFKNVDQIYHLAGIGDIVPSINRPAEYMLNNVNGTINMLEAMRSNKIKSFVYAASSSCYGLAKTPTNESHPIDPKYPYALSKYIGEMIMFHWGKTYGLKTNSICIFNAYGTRVKTTGSYGAVFGVFLKQRLEQKPLTIVGNGEQKRDFVYVSDVVEAFIKCAEAKLTGQRFNIGSGKPKKINELAKLIGGEKVYLPFRPGEPFVTHANITKARKILRWSPKVTFKSGVNNMLKVIDQWKDAPLWNEQSIQVATKDWFKYLGTNVS